MAFKGQVKSKKGKSDVSVEHVLASLDAYDSDRKHTLKVVATEDKSSPNGYEKRLSMVAPEYPPSMMVMMRGVMSGYGTKVFQFRMSRTAALVTSGTGAMALVTNVNPSQFDQFTQLSLLFSEARLKSAKISYSLLVNPYAEAAGTSSILGGSMVSAWNAAATASSTASTATVTRLPNCKIFSINNTNWPVTLRGNVQKNRPWSSISSTSTGIDPVGGIEGGFYHVFMTPVSSATSYFQYILECVYELRNMV